MAPSQDGIELCHFARPTIRGAFVKMFSARSHSRIFAVTVAFTGLGSSACRFSNPGFGKNLRSDTDSPAVATDESQSTQVETDTQSQSATTSNTTTQSASDATSLESSSETLFETAFESSFENSSSETLSSTQSATESDPAAKLVRSYCGRGSIACYPMISVEGDRFEDYGPSRRHILAAGLSTVDANHLSYPFPRVVDAGPQGSYKTSEGYPVPDNGIIGFDVWLRPIRSDSRNWNAFAIDKYISLLRIDSGKLRCAFEASSLSKITETEFEPVAGELYHIACAFDGTKKLMWLNGKLVDSSGTGLPSNWVSPTPYIFGWKSLLENPFDGHIGAIRVWDNIQALEQDITRIFPNP